MIKYLLYILPFSYYFILPVNSFCQMPSCPNVAPVINITEPITGNQYNAGRNISFQVNATDKDGKVVKVEFYNNGIKLAQATAAPYLYIGQTVEAGNYILTAKATDNLGASTTSATVSISVTDCTGGSGTITAEGYPNTAGGMVSDLNKNPSFPNHPLVIQSLHSFEYGPNLGDQYGARVRGYICAPLTGNYTFYIAGDDQAGLWLSTDDDPANKKLIAYNEAWVNPNDWYKFATQKSAPIKLVKGGRYYIESLHKEYVGPDHLSVAWELPGGSLEAPIPGSRLSPVAAAQNGRMSAQEFNVAMRTITIENNFDSAGTTGLKVLVAPNPSRNYFTITTTAKSDKPLSVNVIDIMGRVVETRASVAANGTFQLGAVLSKGIYFIEIKQGTQKERLKLVKL